jgi:hypothetical protein
MKPDWMILKLFPTLALLALCSVLLLSCTRAEVEDTIRAAIGMACGPADESEIWLRTSNSNPTQCPSQATSTGLRIKINQSASYGLDSLKLGTYSGEALDCRTPALDCPSYTATITLTEIKDTEIRGHFQLRDDDGDKVGGRVPFRADVCDENPICG